MEVILIEFSTDHVHNAHSQQFFEIGVLRAANFELQLLLSLVLRSLRKKDPETLQRRLWHSDWMTSQLGWTILSGTERGRCLSFLSLNISDENSEFRKLLINKSTLGSKLGPPQLSGRAMWVGQAWILIWVTKPILARAWARPGSNDLPTSSGLPLALVFSFVFVFLTN